MKRLTVLHERVFWKDEMYEKALMNEKSAYVFRYLMAIFASYIIFMNCAFQCQAAHTYLLFTVTAYL